MNNPSDAIKRFIEKRRAVESAATPGPWSWNEDGGGFYVETDDKVLCGIASGMNRYPEAKQVAEFIADARTSVSLLLKAVEEMAGALEQIRIYADNEEVEMTCKDALSRAAEILGEKE